MRTKKLISIILTVILVLTAGIEWTAVRSEAATVNGSDVVSYAKTFEGYPYVYGTAGPDSFDCSGLVTYVFSHFGIKLPHGTSDFAGDGYKKYGTKITAQSDLQLGDLVYFGTSPDNLEHVGIYIGNDEIENALNPTKGVLPIKINTYYNKDTHAVFQYGVRVSGVSNGEATGNEIDKTNDTNEAKNDTNVDTKKSSGALKVGDIVNFGSRYWDIDISSFVKQQLEGKEKGYYNIDGAEYYYSGEKGFSTVPIRWIVVGEDDSSYTLLQEFVIWGHSYSSDIDAGEVTYGNSEIRKYINSKEFLNAFFRENVQKDILTTTVSWEKGSFNDKLYLPSSDEILAFFPNAESRKAHYYDSYYYGKPDVTTPISGWGDSLAYDTKNCTCAYWTRTSNLEKLGWSQPTYISCDGTVCCGGRVFYTWSSGIRPMMRVKKNSVYLSKAITSLPTEGFKRGSSDMGLEWGKNAFEVVDELKNCGLPVCIQYSAFANNSGTLFTTAIDSKIGFFVGENVISVLVGGMTSRPVELSKTKITIYPKKPTLTVKTNYSIKDNEYKDIRLQWANSSDDYIGSGNVEVCRSTEKDGVYESIYKGPAEFGSGTGCNCVYIDEDVDGKTLYWYKVRGVIQVDNPGSDKKAYTSTLNGYESEFSDPVQAKILVSSISFTETKKELNTGETLQLQATVSPEIASDKTLEWKSGDTGIATVDASGFVKAVSEGTTYIEAYSTDGSNCYARCKITVTKKIDEDTPFFGWYYKEGKAYWYENGTRQGTIDDTNGVMGTDPESGIATNRGREIYDPDSDGWYWLDSIYDGAKAVGKEVWMPYIYQDEDSWNDETRRNIAYESDEGMGECVLNAIRNKSGKWVRYDENGKMLKGWVKIEGALADIYPNQAGNTYYYDTRTGLMAKGRVTIGGIEYFFDEVTGVRQ